MLLYDLPVQCQRDLMICFDFKLKFLQKSCVLKRTKVGIL